MVKEYVEIFLKDIGAHVPPEFPKSLDEELERTFPDWEVYEKNDDKTSIRSKERNAVIITTSKETTCKCNGNYGENLESLKTIGKVIKTIGEFSKRKDIKRKLVENDCIVEIIYGAVPLRDPNFVIDSNIDCLVFEKINVTTLKYESKFYKFLDKYKFKFSRMFKFPDSNFNPYEKMS